MKISWRIRTRAVRAGRALTKRGAVVVSHVSVSRESAVRFRPASVASDHVGSKREEIRARIFRCVRAASETWDE